MGRADDQELGSSVCFTLGTLTINYVFFQNVPGCGVIRGIIWFGTLPRIIAGSGRGPSGMEVRNN